jgi:hypothetical protein
MAYYDLTHLTATEPCSTHDKSGVEIPSDIRDTITKQRSMSERERMLSDMQRAYRGVKAALSLCKTDVRDLNTTSKEELKLKAEVFSKLEFAGLFLGNWKGDFQK